MCNRDYLVLVVYTTIWCLIVLWRNLHSSWFIITPWLSCLVEMRTSLSLSLSLWSWASSSGFSLGQAKVPRRFAWHQRPELDCICLILMYMHTWDWHLTSWCSVTSDDSTHTYIVLCLAGHVSNSCVVYLSLIFIVRRL